MDNTNITVGAIDKIEQLVCKASRINAPIFRDKNDNEFFTHTTKTVNRTYIDSKGAERYTENDKKVFPKIYCSTINTQSLQSIVDYVEGDFEKKVDKTEGLFISIQDIDNVKLYVGADDNAERHCLIDAKLSRELKQFNYDKYLEPENFVVGLHSLFEINDDQVSAIKKASSLTFKETAAMNDNGTGYKGSVSQEVETAVETHIFNLAPFRTFREIKQPESMFVFRTQKNLHCALFEADGGAWRIDAMQKIKKWLSEKLPEVKIIG